MKNITVAVDDEVYKRARVRAAEQDTSVSALVREFLQSLDVGSTDFDRRCRLQDEVMASIRRFRAGNRLSRDAVHRRKR
jgi:plasmid stability protein